MHVNFLLISLSHLQVQLFAARITLLFRLWPFEFIFLTHVNDIRLFRIGKVLLGLRFWRGRGHHLTQIVEQTVFVGGSWRGQLALVKHAHWCV